MSLYKNTNMSETAKRKYADHLYSFATISDKILLEENDKLSMWDFPES